MRAPGDRPRSARSAHAPGRPRLRRRPHRPCVRSAAGFDGAASGPGKAPHPRRGIPFRVPTRPDMPARLPYVLEAIYGAYAIDWLDQHERIRESVADEARWLAVVTASLLGTEPEAWGLAALLTLAQSRAPARTSTPWPPLSQQDTALWDRSLIAEGEALLRRAHGRRAPRTVPARGRHPVRALRPGPHRGGRPRHSHPALSRSGGNCPHYRSGTSPGRAHEGALTTHRGEGRGLRRVPLQKRSLPITTSSTPAVSTRRETSR